MTTYADHARLVVSIDVEDWPQSTWDQALEITQRAADNTARVLDILRSHNRTVTMYVLGKFAERFPQLVRRIADEGHEVASHGYGHIPVVKQTPDEFRQDVERSKRILEDMTGQPVLGYRAPDYSITSRELWVLDMLAEMGFVYDTSIFPGRLTRYGIADWPAGPVSVQLASGRTLVEVPLTTLTLFGRRWPVAGGGYHRLLPWLVIRWAIMRRLRQNQPFMNYCHPYEFDADELSEIDIELPLGTRLHQGLGRRGFHTKFERMLTTFETVLAADLATSYEWPPYAVPKHAIAGSVQ